MSAKRLVLGLLVTTAVSCSAERLVSEEPLPFEVPREWAACGDMEGRVDVMWWRQFASPALEELVEEALQNNQDLKRAASRIDAAAALARISGADLRPSLGAGVVAGRGKESMGAAGYVTGDTYGVSLNASWEIDLWGRVRAGARAAGAGLDASRADFAAARHSIVAQVAKTWFAATEARLQVELTGTTVKTYRAAAGIAASRFRDGVATSLDVRLTRANLASAEAMLAARREILDRTIRQLETLLGRYPRGELEGATDLPSPPAEAPAGLPSEMLARRPDLAAGRWRLLASDRRVAEARAALLPRLSLTASGGTVSGDLADIVKSEASVWNIIGNLLAPIFDGGRLRAKVALKRAEANGLLAGYVGSVLTAFREVESALAAEGTIARREAQLELAVEQAGAARVLAADRYRVGLQDILTVLETQRRELDARSRLLAARRARLDNRVDLHLALGGGFDMGTPASSDAVAAAPEGTGPVSGSGMLLVADSSAPQGMGGTNR
ncbi:MAG: efflux transporter outer membrane subunit [Planctomycetota bacterium]